MSEPAELLVASNNQGKLREYAALLAGLPFELITLAEKGITAEIEETGLSMEENAIHKAISYAALSGLITLLWHRFLFVCRWPQRLSNRSHS